jgi:hypothetical protein
VKKLFREHKGLLSESMQTVREVESLNDVWKIYGLDEYKIKKDMKIEWVNLIETNKRRKC